MSESNSLDGRRPLFLRDLVGNRGVVGRLSQQMKKGSVPRRAFFYGPTGSGKTTTARILVRHFFCENRGGIGDPCGRCGACRKPLAEVFGYEQWTAARLEQNWGWWEYNGRSVLARPDWAFFLDEAQDLGELHQKDFYDMLEAAEALVIFATTHKNAIKDALVNRFGANVYELKRPSPAEVVAHLQGRCQALDVRADDAQLARVVAHYGCDLRKCVDFAHTAADQAPNGAVTAEFVDDVLGLDRTAGQNPLPEPDLEALKL